jgi:hypothetical protein
VFDNQASAYIWSFDMVKRRPRKSIEQWKAIVDDQQASGLSRLEYCLKHDIHIDTFSARLSKINRGLNGRCNVSADSITRPQLVKVSTPRRKAQHEFIAIAFADVEVRFPLSVQAEWFAQVLAKISQPDVDIDALLPWVIKLG